MFRRNYLEDPELADRVFALLETWFVGIAEPRRVALRLGGRWDDCSTPFVHEHAGRIVAHVGLLDMPYVIHGKRVQLGGVHGVCTLESERRKGHFRRLMEDLLEYCEPRFETLVLSTEHPEYYEPFGFRVVPEHRFIADVGSPGGKRGFRPFDIDRAEDLQRLDEVLQRRAAVSNRVGIVEEHQVFKFSQGTTGLYYSDALDCFAVLDFQGRRLVLSDLVALEIPPLTQILAEVDSAVDEVEFHFSPDRFDVVARPEFYRWDSDYYMVRGPFAAEGETFMVPPSARH